MVPEAHMVVIVRDHRDGDRQVHVRHIQPPVHPAEVPLHEKQHGRGRHPQDGLEVGLVTQHSEIVPLDRPG